MVKSGRAGNAGIIATIGIAFVGVVIGALSSYLGNRGVIAAASPDQHSGLTIERSQHEARRDKRDQLVAAIVGGKPPPERLIAPLNPIFAQTDRPKIVIIVDDMGVDARATQRALNLPGPITFSFLPYAKNVAAQAARARHLGAETMLHLPMEPRGRADPGPNALVTGMTGGDFIENLEWNLSRFDGYTGVNNHMGSQLTADIAAMKTLLGYLDHRDLFFLDSLTTRETVVRRAADALGVDVYARDVFLDDKVGDEGAVKKQLALAERIARETGYAVAIGHPRKETLDVLGPWLTSAPSRGLDLVFVSTLPALSNPQTALDLHAKHAPEPDEGPPEILTAQPDLRL